MRDVTGKHTSKGRSFWKSLVVLAVLATTLTASPTLVSGQSGDAPAPTDFTEEAEGDISGDAANPTVLTVVPGSNLVSGDIIAGDIDYVTLNVPEGYTLSALDLQNYESASDGLSFIGVQEGTVFTETPDAPEVGNLLGFTLFGADAAGTDILPAIGSGEGAQGFTGPLPAGDYTFWIQEIGSDLASYYFDITISLADTPAPEAPETPAPAAAAVQFTFENLQPDDGFFFTEAWVGLHNGDFNLFTEGERATPGLEALAEGGNTELLGAEFEARGRLQATVGNGEVQFISPGETIQGSIDIINPAAYRYASFASMIIPSNDGFFGENAVEVFDADGNPTGDIEITIYGQDIYDSGTEVNDAQGAAGFSLGPNGNDGGESTDDPTSVVAPHPDLFDNIVGIQTAAGTTVGSNGSGPIAPDEAVARITISVGDSINTASAVGPLFNGSTIETPAPEAPAPEAPAPEAPAPEAPAPEFDRVEFVNHEFGPRYLEVQPNVNVYSSNQSNTATEFYLIAVDGVEDTYLIKSVSTGLYLHANGADGQFNVNVVGPVDDTAYWQLFEFNGSYHIFNVGLERLLEADRPGFNVDTDREVIDTEDFGLSVEWDIVPAN